MTTTPKVLFLVASIAALFAATTAFAPTAPTTISSISTTTSLRSIIFEPPPEDNCELDGSDCEDSVFARKRQERNENQQATKDRYRAMGVALSEADFVQSVDQYQNNPTGGGLIAGIQLTALCEDDWDRFDECWIHYIIVDTEEG